MAPSLCYHATILILSVVAVPEGQLFVTTMLCCFLTFGRLIAIMLARLRMTVEEASDEFATIANVYKQINITPEERTQRLRNYLEDVLRRKELPVHTKLLDERPTQACAWYVVLNLHFSAIKTRTVLYYQALALTLVQISVSGVI